MENNLDFEALNQLILSDNIYEMMNIAAELVAGVSGCERICFIAREKENFYIRAGVPKTGHSIGTEITCEYGKGFLEQVMNKKKMIMITHPAQDPRAAYMKGLIDFYKINSILYAPLYYKNIDIGILVIDAVEKHNDFNLKKIKELSKFCAMAIGKELERRSNYKETLEKIKEMENLSALGKHTAGISHTFRNKLSIIGGFTRNIFGKIDKNAGFIPDSDKREKIKRELKIIFKEVLELEKFVSEIMIFCRIPNCIVPEKNNINNFLKETIETFNLKEKNIEFLFEFEKHLDKTVVYFDKRYFGASVQDIIKNAVEAKATIILVKTEFYPEQNSFQVIIANNGEKIKPDELKDIFSPFFTTKPNGTGLGLANVYATITAPSHGGHIEARSGDEIISNNNRGFTTRFEISFPLKIANFIAR
ncbi:hypothetical protein HZB05_01145 [Candidatus Wolfebacteria bacterium]|nr:hypothetical protein [Candidatus Wolfebacteria bacterium]